jgi:hypothetical protein
MSERDRAFLEKDGIQAGGDNETAKFIEMHVFNINIHYGIHSGEGAVVDTGIQLVKYPAVGSQSDCSASLGTVALVP